MRLLAAAQTPAIPEADMSAPNPLMPMKVSKVLAGVESKAVFPWKLFSSAEDIPVCESVESDHPELVWG